MITSQESHTPCTLAPQPQAAQLTLHRDRVHIWSPLRSWVGTQEMHRNPHIWMQLIPSHHFLQLWLVPTCHSRAVSPAPTPGLCSAPSRENPHLGASHRADTLRKVMPDPPDTKAQHKNLLLLALLSCQPHLWSPWKPHHRRAAAWGQGDAGTSQPWSWTSSQVTHTQFGNLGLGQVLCIRMAESSEIISKAG